MMEMVAACSDSLGCVNEVFVMLLQVQEKILNIMYILFLYICIKAIKIKFKPTWGIDRFAIYAVDRIDTAPYSVR